MHPFILTTRCLIRVPELSDATLMQAAIQQSHKVLKRWMPWAQSVASVRDTEHFLLQAIHAWNNKMVPHIEQPLVIMDKSNTNFIGATGVRLLDEDVPSYEVGYWVNSLYSGQGLITEAVNGLVQYLFEVGNAKRVEICCEKDNIKSCNVAEHLNFTLEAVLKNHRVTADLKKVTDTKLYVCTSKDKLENLPVSWR